MKYLDHATLIVGENINPKDLVKNILKDKLNFSIDKNPDFLIFERETFGIDDARDFLKWSYGKPLTGEIKATLLIFDSITFEAQNSLLKVLEEPKLGNFVFIHLNSNGELLPTLLSRVRVYEVDKNNDRDIKNNLNKDKILINSNFRNKIKLVKDFTKNDSKKRIFDMFSEIEKDLYFNDTNSEKSNHKKLQKILKAKKYISSRGSPQKSILEWLISVI